MSHNKVAIINGAYGGMGFAIAEHFAMKGFSLTLLGRSQEKLKQVETSLMKYIASKDQTINIVPIDMSSEASVQQVVGRLKLKQTAPDVFINACGIVKIGGLHEVNTNDWEEALQTNLVNMVHLVTAVSAKMKEAAKQGSIVLVNGVLSRQPEGGLVINSTITGAVSSFAKAISKDLGQYGIRVNTINPGVTRTGLYENIVNELANKFNVSTKTIEENMANKSPQKCIAKVEDIVNAVDFLCAESSKHVNGIFLTVDGGAVASY